MRYRRAATRVRRVPGTSPGTARRQVAFIAEGCYPYVTGGVSTWSNQLIGGLPEIDFHVVAITGSHVMPLALSLPANVAGVRDIPLWGWTPQGARPTRAARRAFADVFPRFLDALLDPTAARPVFAAALHEMFDLAQCHDLPTLMATDVAVEILTSAWNTHVADRPMSLRDAIDSVELMEHMLRPLSAPVVEADLCHVVSNGLPVLVALAAKWADATPYVMSEHGVYLRERYLAFRSVSAHWCVKSFILTLYRHICETGYDLADTITPVTSYNQRWEEALGAAQPRIVVAHNGVDPAAFPQATGEPDVPTIGWVGRIDPLKDLDTLIAAFAIIHEQRPDVRLRLFGPIPAGNEDYAAGLAATVAQAGLDDVITFEGPVRPSTKAYHASTIVALSSISEGLPYTVIEAMMCGRVTVSTDVGGVAECVGDAGLVVPPRDPERLATACLAALADEQARTTMGAAARRRALATFPLDKMLRLFRDVYATTITPCGLVDVPPPASATRMPREWTYPPESEARVLVEEAAAS